MDITNVWNNIIKNAGEKFYTRTGIEFTYSLIDNNTILPNNIRNSILLPITKNTIDDVITNHWPVKSVSQLQSFYAPSYIYAIVNDTRII